MKNACAIWMPRGCGGCGERQKVNVSTLIARIVIVPRVAAGYQDGTGPIKTRIAP